MLVLIYGGSCGFDLLEFKFNRCNIAETLDLYGFVLSQITMHLSVEINIPKYIKKTVKTLFFMYFGLLDANNRTATI